MTVLSDLLADLKVASQDDSNPDRLVAHSFINSLNSLSSSLRNATPPVDTVAAFAEWDRSVRALETFTGNAGPPLDSGDIQAAQQRTATAVARARSELVAPEVIGAVEKKPHDYERIVQRTSRAAAAQTALDAEMADAQQYLDYLAVT